MNNRLVCTFRYYNEIEDTIKEVLHKYHVEQSKIFVISIKDSDEVIITYNVDTINIEDLLERTVLIHRKKQTNTLYTLNGLNLLIKEENNGVLDKSYSINWDNYRNMLIIEKNGDLKLCKTQIYKIIEN